MEPLLKQLRDLPRRFTALPAAARYGVLGLLAVLVLGAVLVGTMGDSGSYQYAFTNLTPEDSTEAGGVLKTSGIPFRMEAGGSALAVPTAKVHEARLLLASAGLPKGGGVGFEIFDRGDLGISEFTQKVNLRRAIEGELARTIGRLSPVRSARVHITLPEKGLYRNEDRKATAAVVLNLQPGRTVAERELAGVRHLVAASVAGLNPDSVTVMDGRGTVLAGDKSEGAKLASEQRDLESALEQRIVDLLEPVVGRGAVVAKVTASLDTSETESTKDSYDPDTAAVRSERSVVEEISSDSNTGSGVAGAAANQPLAPTTGGGSNGNRSQTNRQDNLKNFELTKTVTHTVAHGPRLIRLSAAVLVSGVGGKAREGAELKRLGELAKHAVGFDGDRGDRFDISSAPFATEQETPAEVVPVWARPVAWKLAGGGLGVLLLLLIIAATLLRRKVRAADVALLKPGQRVGQVEAAMKKGDAATGKALEDLEAGARGPGLPPGKQGPSLIDQENEAQRQSDELQARARELTTVDPARAAHLLRAWINMDFEGKEMPRG